MPELKQAATPDDLRQRARICYLADSPKGGMDDVSAHLSNAADQIETLNATITSLQQRLAAVEGERDAERDARDKLDKALRDKDGAMGELFQRLCNAGVDCSDLIP